MDSTRQQKINRLLQKELSEVFQHQTQAAHGLLVSVSSVKVSPDLSTARIYLSIFPGDNRQSIISTIQKNARSIRYELAERLRFQLRRMPEFSFFLDDTLDYAESIDTLLNKINQE
jgi:ribosome-binding factor A